MSLLEWANLGGTLLTFGCFSFAVTNFGGKLGRVSGFQNTTGSQYITHSNNSDKLFEDVVKVYANDTNAPEWVKDKDKLRERCKNYQYSLKHWADTSKYCLVQSNVRHKLIEKGITLRDDRNHKCTEDLLNTYSDGTESFAFLLAKKECKKQEEVAPQMPEQSSQPATSAGSAPAVDGDSSRSTQQTQSSQNTGGSEGVTSAVSSTPAGEGGGGTTNGIGSSRDGTSISSGTSNVAENSAGGGPNPQ